MAEPDVRLLIGVARGGKDGNSDKEIKREIEDILSKLKPKIKLDAKDFTSQVRKQLGDISKDGKFYIKVSNIKLGENAIADFRRQLNAVIDTLSVEKGVNVSVTSKVNNSVSAAPKTSGSSLAAETAALVAYNEAQKERAEITETVANAETQADKTDKSRMATNQQVLNTYKQLNDYLAKNPRAAGTSQGSQLADIRDELGRVARAGEGAADGMSAMTGVDLRTTQEQINRLKISLRESGKEGRTVGGIIKSAYAKFGGWMLVTRSMTSVIRSLKEMVDNVRQIDAAMTELKKVTNETDAVYSKFLTNAASRARTLGVTVADIITATADFARLGYSIDEASTLADVATIYKNVGDGIDSISTASESIISTMKAFGIEAKDAMLIVDKFNEVGNNFAISSKGVGDALIRSAAALRAAGNSLDESIALVTAANNVVQDPDKVGTTMKTVSMFLRAAKTEAEEAGESTEGMANSVSELRGELLALTGGKVDIQLDENTFKSTYDIIKDLSKVWSELTDITKANILEMIGGKRNSNVVAALLEDFSTADKVVETAANSAGSAMAENEKYLDSINGKVAQFQASFEKLSMTVVNSEFVKGVVDFGTSVVDVLTKIVDLLGDIPTLLGAISIAMSMAKKQSILSPNSVTYSLKGGWHRGFSTGVLSQINLDTDAVMDYIRQTDEAGISLESLTKDSEAFEAITNKSMTSASNIAREYAQTLTDTGVSADFVQKQLLKLHLKAKWSTAEQVLKNLGWTLAITAIPKWISLMRSYQDDIAAKAVNKSNEIKNAYIDTTKSIQQNIDTLKGLDSEFSQLSGGVDKYGHNISLSADNYERYKEIVQQITDISPSVVARYDEENNRLADKNKLLERAIELQEEEYRRELRRRTSPDKTADALSGPVATYAAADSDRQKYQRELQSAFNSALKNGDDILDRPERGAGEAVAAKILHYLGIDNIAEELQKYVTETGRWNPDWFWKEYADRIAEDINSGHSNILARLDYSDLGFDNQTELDYAIANIESSASQYNDASQLMSDANKDVFEELKLIAESTEEYGNLSDDAKAMVDGFAQTFGVDDVSKSWMLLSDVLRVDDESLAEIRARIKTFVAKLTPEISDLAARGIKLKNGFDINGNEISISEYKATVQEIQRKIDSIDNEDLRLELNAIIGVKEGDIDRAIEHAKNLLEYGEESSIDGLSAKQVLDIYYNISADPHSLTFDELQEMLEDSKTDWDTTVNVLDFSSVADNLDSVKSSVADLVGAMEKLRAGTKLTNAEMLELAMKYPKMLEASNLFTNSSIENQKAVLTAALEAQENEYNGYLDSKIKELEVTNQLIQDQIELEGNKKDKVIEIVAMQENGKLDLEEDYQAALQDLQDLEGKNRVIFSNGVLSVNKDMLEDKLAQEEQSTEASRDIWTAVGSMIVESHGKGLASALTRFPQYLSKLKEWNASALRNELMDVAVAIKKAYSGDNNILGMGVVTKGIASMGDTFGKIANDLWGKDNAGITLGTQIEGSLTIDGQTVSDWAAKYEDIIEQRVQALKDVEITNIEIINNLKSMKGLDLVGLYGESSGSSGSGSKTEKYIADIDEYYKALKRLESVQIRMAAIQNNIDSAKTDEEKIAYTKQLISVYRDEASALDNLNKLRTENIKNGVTQLESLGFIIDYNEKTNEFVVQNMERLNQLEGATDEATSKLREDTEEFINTLNDLNDANQEGVDNMNQAVIDAKNAEQDILDYLNNIVTAANDAIDSIQNVYSTLKSAADEYAKNGGFISVDAFQSIVELGPEYMQYLKDENGLLVINEENINRVIAAKTEQLALENALSYVERLRLALQDDSIEDLNQLLYATTDATNSTWGLVYADLALLDLNGDQYDAALHNINAIRSIAKNAIAGIGLVGEGAENMRDGLDDTIGYVMDMIKQKVEDEIDALNKMKDAYGDIISLRKEALDAAKDEADYEDDVADRVKEIAKLQNRINALSLDDSRSAQAQKVKLEEEMAKLQKELGKFQNEHAIEAQKEALDKMKEDYDAEKDAEIAELEESISSQQKLYDKAINYITDKWENDWDSLFTELLSWNYKYGSELESTLVSAWDKATLAAEKYNNSVKNAMQVYGLGNGYGEWGAGGEGGTGSGLGTDGSGSGNKVVANAVSNWPAGNIPQIVNKIGEMYRNTQAWHTANASYRQWLEDRNYEIGTVELKKLGINAYRDEASGIWYDEDGQELYKKYDKIKDKFHTGGIVGRNPTTKQNEVMALLEKGEAVLDDKKEKGLYRIVDFATILSERLGKAIDTSALLRSFPKVNNGFAELAAQVANGAVGSPAPSIHFGDVYISGADESTLEKHREINRQFTNEVLKQLNIKK